VKPERPKVVDLQKRKYAKTVMHFYDKFDRAIKREERVEKSEVERDARKRWYRSNRTLSVEPYQRHRISNETNLHLSRQLC
jgi:hypothetical protein